jgi:exodeoxyribonuclease-5
MSLTDRFIHAFPFEPTDGQLRLFHAFEQFLLDRKNAQSAFLIKGFAGTGKTTVVSALIKVLNEHRKRVVLLAPTGRAAKVLASYSGFKAFTIHRFIYRTREDGEGFVQFSLQRNTYENTVFFVDEASMISDETGNRLLTDLIMFVYSNPGNKLVLIGDTAQLPPVGRQTSPALDASILSAHHRLQVTEALLTKVMRQQMESGILYNATRIRAWLQQKEVSPMLTPDSFRDIVKLSGSELEEFIRSTMDQDGEEECLIITGSNARANQYNRYIRSQIFFREYELEAGDRLMVVKNNYLFLPEDSKAGFIANGDFVEVLKIRRETEQFGFRFADLTVQLTDYRDEPPFDVRVWLDSLHCPGPAMSQEDHKKLYEAVKDDYLSSGSKKKGIKTSLKKDITLHALQIKYAYALTCHKAQGGQWKTIFLEPGFYKKGEKPSHEYLRWLYTGITRASERLFLLGFPEAFFEENGF